MGARRYQIYAVSLLGGWELSLENRTSVQFWRFLDFIHFSQKLPVIWPDAELMPIPTLFEAWPACCKINLEECVSELSSIIRNEHFEQTFDLLSSGSSFRVSVSIKKFLWKYILQQGIWSDTNLTLIDWLVDTSQGRENYCVCEYS